MWFGLGSLGPLGVGFDLRGWRWDVLRSLKRLWEVLKRFERFWEVFRDVNAHLLISMGDHCQPKCFQRFWEVLRCLQMLWSVLIGFEVLLGAKAIQGGFARDFKYSPQTACMIASTIQWGFIRAYRGHMRVPSGIDRLGRSQQFHSAYWCHAAPRSICANRLCKIAHVVRAKETSGKCTYAQQWMYATCSAIYGCI